MKLSSSASALSPVAISRPIAAPGSITSTHPPSPLAPGPLRLSSHAFLPTPNVRPSGQKKRGVGRLDWPKAAFPCARTFQHSPTSGPRRGGPCRGSRRRPRSLRPRNSRARPNTWRSVCIMPVAANFASAAAFSRSTYDFDPWHGLSPLRRSIVAIVGRRPAGGWVPVERPLRNTQPSHARDRPAPRRSRRARGETRIQNRPGREVGANRHRGPGQETVHQIRLPRRLPGHRANSTGVPGKFSRTARIMTDAARPNAAQMPNKPRPRPRWPALLAHTGAPDNKHRGPQQDLPGPRTKTTGVPDKSCRGTRQILPGLPTRAHR